MVEIMKSVWKGLLVPIPNPECTTLPSPSSLRHKFLVKVKHVDPKKAAAKAKAKDKDKSPRPSSSSASEDEATPEIKKKKKKSTIIPALSDLGIYTQAFHFSSLSSPDAELPTHVFSLSEKKLMEVHSSSGPTLFSHNRNYLMRAFPSGMRVRSDNLDPAVFWRKGVQFVALNWQRWDEGMMLNEGMFAGSAGYVLKPNGYRGVDNPSARESQADAIAHKTLNLTIEVLAAQDVPLPLGDTRPDGFHPYVKVELHVEKPAERTGAPIEGGGRSKEGEYKWKSRTMKGTEVDFGGEKVEFKDIPGVVEELSFIRYVRPFTFPPCLVVTLVRFSVHRLCWRKRWASLSAKVGCGWPSPSIIGLANSRRFPCLTPLRLPGTNLSYHFSTVLHSVPEINDRPALPHAHYQNLISKILFSLQMSVR